MACSGSIQTKLSMEMSLLPWLVSLQDTSASPFIGTTAQQCWLKSSLVFNQAKTFSPCKKNWSMLDLSERTRETPSMEHWHFSKKRGNKLSKKRYAARQTTTGKAAFIQATPPQFLVENFPPSLAIGLKFHKKGARSDQRLPECLFIFSCYAKPHRKKPGWLQKMARQIWRTVFPFAIGVSLGTLWCPFLSHGQPTSACIHVSTTSSTPLANDGHHVEPGRSVVCN